MIARFTTLLPFYITISEDKSLSVYEISQDNYQVKVYPPTQSRISYSDIGMYSPIQLGEVARALEPATPQVASRMVLINGTPTVRANLMQVDFSKESFDRRRRPASTVALSAEQDLNWGEPLPRLAFALVNGLRNREKTS